MLEIIAAAYEDGVAFVRDGDVVFLVRPPYNKGLEETVKSEEVNIAITFYGFSAQSLSFQDWEDVYRHLNKEAKQAFIKNRGYWPKEDELREEIARVVPKDIIENWLSRIKRNELPKEGALELLENLKVNDAVISDQKLQDEIQNLIVSLEKLSLPG